MKNNNFPKNQELVGPALPATAEDLKQNSACSKPSPDEVAKRAYFTYVNQGSPQGHEVQHWLQAEAELIQEHNLSCQ